MNRITALLPAIFLGISGYAIADDEATEKAASDAGQPEQQLRLTMDPMYILDPGAKKTAETTGRAGEPLAPELESLLEEAEAAQR